MAVMVFMEWHLCLNIMAIKEKDKAFLQDTHGLPGEAVNTIVNRFREAKQQLAAFKELIPRCVQESPWCTVIHQPDLLPHTPYPLSQMLLYTASRVRRFSSTTMLMNG